MTRQIVSNSGQPVSVVTNLPFETTDLNRLEIARISGADGCYPVPPDEETSEDFDPTLEDILEDILDDIFNPFP